MWWLPLPILLLPCLPYFFFFFYCHCLLRTFLLFHLAPHAPHTPRGTAHILCRAPAHATYTHILNPLCPTSFFYSTIIEELHTRAARRHHRGTHFPHACACLSVLTTASHTHTPPLHTHTPPLCTRSVCLHGKEWRAGAYSSILCHHPLSRPSSLCLSTAAFTAFCLSSGTCLALVAASCLS